MGKWIEFVDVSDDYVSKKTKTFNVENKENGFILGQIKWYGGFRKYGFYTHHRDCIFEPTCLRDIADFIDGLMKERKDKKNDN
jgi:hypothetical protein